MIICGFINKRWVNSYFKDMKHISIKKLNLFSEKEQVQSCQKKKKKTCYQSLSLLRPQIYHEEE